MKGDQLPICPGGPNELATIILGDGEYICDRSTLFKLCHSEERRFTIIDNLSFDQGRTSGSLDMKGPRNSVWTSSFLRINEEGKLVGRHLDFFGSTDLHRSRGMHVPNATSLEDIRISGSPETELGVDFCLTWNIDPRWVFIGYELTKKSTFGI